MIGHEIPATTGDEAARVVRALGGHRYVAARLHLVHAFAIAGTISSEAGDDPLREAREWAEGALKDPSIDRASRDERLVRRATDRELAAIVRAYWSDETAEKSRDRVRALVREAGLEDATRETLAPFEEGREDEMFPLLIDAGWELLPLFELDPERHRGVIESYGAPIFFQAARFVAETCVPPPVYLHELPAMGVRELCEAVDARGALASPFVLWSDCEETYDDYVLRGVMRAAKLPERDLESDSDATAGAGGD